MFDGTKVLNVKVWQFSNFSTKVTMFLTFL